MDMIGSSAIAAGKNNYWTNCFFEDYCTVKTGYPFEYYFRFEAAKGEVKYRFTKYAEDENGYIDDDAVHGEERKHSRLNRVGIVW